MSTPHLNKDELDCLVSIAGDAGAAIMDIYLADERGIQIKADDSPLTAADLASHQVIINGLKRHFPDIPVMSEEAADIPYSERKQWQKYWLVDPLDGTKEFIKRNGEFTVNIALVVEGRAVAGVVYAPVPDTFYVGELTLGAWSSHKGVSQPLTGGSTRVQPVVVGSRSHPYPVLADYLASLGEHEMVSVGSSLKFCLLAEGRADIYPRLGPTSEWDTAAAQAVLESAGGKVVNYETGDTLSYNTKESVLNPWFIASAPGWSR